MNGKEVKLRTLLNPNGASAKESPWWLVSAPGALVGSLLAGSNMKFHQASPPLCAPEHQPAFR
jgi:hypothetical protein